MELLVVRHGRTRSNAEGRYQGTIDTDLDEVGVEQALALDARLPRDIDLVISSPLLRARHTAEIFCAARGLDVTFDDAFRERGLGVFEGLTSAESRARYSDLWARGVTRLWGEAPPGGESIGVVFVRVAAGLEALRTAHEGRRVLLVAHGYVSKVIRAVCTGRVDDFFQWLLGNGETLEVAVPVHELGRMEELREAFEGMARHTAGSPDPAR